MGIRFRVDALFVSGSSSNHRLEGKDCDDGGPPIGSLLHNAPIEEKLYLSE